VAALLRLSGARVTKGCVSEILGRLSEFSGLYQATADVNNMRESEQLLLSTKCSIQVCFGDLLSEQSAHRRSHFHALSLAWSGQSPREVSELLSVKCRTLQRWVARYCSDKLKELGAA